MTLVPIKIKHLVFLIIFTIIAVISPYESIYAQTGISLEPEINNLERIVANPGSAAERHGALVRLARLKQLTGDIEGAARNWLEAATAISGRVDDDALLACAYCLTAMGEWDRAIIALEPLLSKNVQARFLDISIKAMKTGDVTALAAIADNPEYSELKNQIIFTLWKITNGSSSERWRQRLVTEFSQTPEGRLAAGGTSSTVVIRPSAFWLFSGGLDSLPLLESMPSSQTSASVTQVSTSNQPPVSQPAISGARLQTGAFSRQANAQAQFTSLRQAGFSPSIEQRVVNNTDMWAVTVPAGPDHTRTMNDLRAAGFDPFLIR